MTEYDKSSSSRLPIYKIQSPFTGFKLDFNALCQRKKGAIIPLLAHDLKGQQGDQLLSICTIIDEDLPLVINLEQELQADGLTVHKLRSKIIDTYLFSEMTPPATNAESGGGISENQEGEEETEANEDDAGKKEKRKEEISKRTSMELPFKKSPPKEASSAPEEGAPIKTRSSLLDPGKAPNLRRTERSADIFGGQEHLWSASEGLSQELGYSLAKMYKYLMRIPNAPATIKELVETQDTIHGILAQSIGRALPELISKNKNGSVIGASKLFVALEDQALKTTNSEALDERKKMIEATSTYPGWIEHYIRRIEIQAERCNEVGEAAMPNDPEIVPNLLQVMVRCHYTKDLALAALKDPSAHTFDDLFRELKLRHRNALSLGWVDPAPPMAKIERKINSELRSKGKMAAGFMLLENPTPSCQPNEIVKAGAPAARGWEDPWSAKSKAQALWAKKQAGKANPNKRSPSTKKPPKERAAFSSIICWDCGEPEHKSGDPRCKGQKGCHRFKPEAKNPHPKAQKPKQEGGNARQQGGGARRQQPGRGIARLAFYSAALACLVAVAATSPAPKGEKDGDLCPNVGGKETSTRWTEVATCALLKEEGIQGPSSSRSEPTLQRVELGLDKKEHEFRRNVDETQDLRVNSVISPTEMRDKNPEDWTAKKGPEGGCVTTQPKKEEKLPQTRKRVSSEHRPNLGESEIGKDTSDGCQGTPNPALKSNEKRRSSLDQNGAQPPEKKERMPKEKHINNEEALDSRHLPNGTGFGTKTWPAETPKGGSQAELYLGSDSFYKDLESFAVFFCAIVATAQCFLSWMILTALERLFMKRIRSHILRAVLRMAIWILHAEKRGRYYRRRACRHLGICRNNRDKKKWQKQQRKEARMLQAACLGKKKPAGAEAKKTRKDKKQLHKRKGHGKNGEDTGTDHSHAQAENQQPNRKCTSRASKHKNDSRAGYLKHQARIRFLRWFQRNYPYITYDVNGNPKVLHSEGHENHPNIETAVLLNNATQSNGEETWTLRAPKFVRKYHERNARRSSRRKRTYVACATRSYISEQALRAAENRDFKQLTHGVVDSGSTDFMFGDKRYFTEMHKVKRTIMTASKERTIEITEAGTVELLVWLKSGEPLKLRFKEVLYSKEFTANLISVSRLVENGFKIQLGKESNLITSKGPVSLQSSNFGLYLLPMQPAKHIKTNADYSALYASASFIAKTDRSELLHM